MESDRDWLMRSFGMRFGLQSRRCITLAAEIPKLPEPLQGPARAMDEAKTRDEEIAAAREFLVLSEEWTA